MRSILKVPTKRGIWHITRGFRPDPFYAYFQRRGSYFETFIKFDAANSKQL